MAKKIHLKISGGKPDYIIIGISCHLRDYRIIYRINKSLDFHFKKIKELKVLLGKTENHVPFSLYHFYRTNRIINYYFISNHHPDAKLITDLKQADYFLFIHGEVPEEEKKQLIKKLSNIKDILAVFDVNPATLKQFEPVLYDLELHMGGLGG